METVEEKEEIKKQQWKKPWRSLFMVIINSHPWDALPSLALLNIFKNLNFKDRFGSIPLVCKEWNSTISNDPRCWSSMIPDSISPDDAFIKKPVYSDDAFIKKLVYSVPVVRVTGVSYLRNLITKSSSGGSGSSSSTITSLCLDRFHFFDSKTYVTVNILGPCPNTNVTPLQDEVLHLIAHCCPNLKHISFDGFYCASIEAVLEVFHRCKKIELIDFSDSGYADSVQVIEELGKCLPNLRGIRMAGWKDYSIHDAIATHLPRIKLLAVDYRSSCDEDFQKLTSEIECCLYELQYLSVGLWKIDPHSHTPPVCCTHIPEFHYEKLLGCECKLRDYDKYDKKFKPLRSVHQPKFRPRLVRYKQVCYHCRCKKEEDANRGIDKAEEAKEKAKEKAKEAYSECSEKYFGFYYEDYSVMKQKKKYEYDVYISKEKKKRKKTRRNYSYLVLRTRMRKNKIIMNHCYSFNTDES